MRIGIYDPYLDDLGGGEKYMMTAAECLSQKNEVTVFWDDKKDVDKLIQRFSLNFDKVKLNKNIFSSNVSLPKRILATRKYDVIIMLIDGSIPIVSSKKLFLHIQQPLLNIDISSLKDKLKLLRINSIFYNSKFTKSFNDKIFKKIESSVIYPPVNIISKKLVKENIIITVGRFRVINNKNDDYKKQQIIVNVFKEMVDKGLKNWKFIVATSVNNEKDSKFKRMISSGNGYPIEFVVNKNNKELWEFYNKAKIYWHASGYGENLDRYPELAEHFGISTVEAMGVGVVPVVINAGGQKEIIENGKTGYLWNTLDELKDYTNKLISDKDVWTRMSSIAKIRSNDFSKENFCRELENLIK